MKTNKKGFTLIELIVTVSLLMIVLVGGTSIFYKSFRSSGVSDVQSVLNSSLRSIGEMIEKGLLFNSVVSVTNAGGIRNRNYCLTQPAGVTGSTLKFKDAQGGEATYTFVVADSAVSSNSAVISNPGIKVTKLNFTWICKSGVNDKINLEIEANSSAKTGDTISGKLNKEILLLNSGTN